MANQQPSYAPALLALGAGIASHLFYFRIGEHHMLPVVYIQLFTLACAVGAVYLVSFAEAPTFNAVVTVSGLASCWLVGVFGSLLTYRSVSSFTIVPLRLTTA